MIQDERIATAGVTVKQQIAEIQEFNYKLSTQVQEYLEEKERLTEELRAMHHQLSSPNKIMQILTTPQRFFFVLI